MKARRSAVFPWAVLFLAAVYIPIVLYARAEAADSVAMHFTDLLGLISLSLMACVVTLTARIRPLTRAIKLVQIVWTHQFLGAVTVLFVFIHIALVVWDDSSKIWLLDPWRATPASRAASVSTLALVGLALMGRLRTRRPELWRWLHVTFAVTALTLAGLHVYWLNHLIRIPELRAWFIICAAVVILALADRWLLKPLRYLRSGYRVTEVRSESPTTSTIVLVPVGSRHHRHVRQAAPFRSGQYAWIRLHAVPTATERPFTICSSAQNRTGFEFTVRQVGRFTTQLAALRPGRRVWLDGPHGAFSVPRNSVGIVGIAAGVGITPIMSILRTLADRGDTRPHRLIVGARTEDEFLFRSEIHNLFTRLDLSMVEILSQPTPSWAGVTGRIGRDLLHEFLPRGAQRSRLDYFVCGPKDMVTSVVAALTSFGIPGTHINIEYLPAAPRAHKQLWSPPGEATKPNLPIHHRQLGPSTGPIGVRVGQPQPAGPGTGAHRRSSGPSTATNRAVPAPRSQRQR